MNSETNQPATGGARRAFGRAPISKPWSDDDVAALRQLWAAGVTLQRAALRLKRSQSSVRSKAVQLGLVRPPRAE
jgi:hypothetical protein